MTTTGKVPRGSVQAQPPGLDRFALEARTQARAVGLKTYPLTDGQTFAVKSRSQDGYYTLGVSADGRVTYCDCKGWQYRQICPHALAVEKRVRRNGR